MKKYSGKDIVSEIGDFKNDILEITEKTDQDIAKELNRMKAINIIVLIFFVVCLVLLICCVFKYGKIK